jgi:hypothetical protein
MPFTAPDSDLMEPPSQPKGFSAPDSDLPSKGFSAPEGDLVDVSKIQIPSAGGQPGEFGPASDNSELLTAIAQNPKGFMKSLPGDVMSVTGGLGDIARAGVGDVAAAVTRQPEAGGNLTSLMGAPEEQQPQPQDQELAWLSRSNPKLATAGKIAQATVGMAPMVAVGALPSWAIKLVSAGFSADMIRKAPALFQQYAEEVNKPANEQDPDKITSLESDIAQTFAFAPLAGAHGAAGVIDRVTAPRSNFDFATASGTPKDAAPPLAGESPALPPKPSGGFTAPAADLPTQPGPTILPSDLPPAAVKYAPLVQKMMDDVNTTAQVQGSKQGQNRAMNPSTPADDVLGEIKANVAPDGTKPPVAATSPPENETKPAESGTVGPVSETPAANSPPSTIAEAAAANPDRPVTMADLAALQREMTANQVKPVTEPPTIREFRTVQPPSEPVQTPSESKPLPTAPEPAPSGVADNLPAQIKWPAGIQPRAILDALAKNAGGESIDEGRKFALSAEYTWDGLAKALGGSDKTATVLRESGIVTKDPESGNYRLNHDLYQNEIESLRNRGFLPKSQPIPVEAPKNTPALSDGGTPGKSGPQPFAETPQAINAKTWYHGTGTAGLKASDLDPFYGSHESLMGQGVYLTDNPDIAGGYAKNRGVKTKTPTTYQAKVSVGNVLDLGKPAPDVVRSIFSDLAAQHTRAFHGSEVEDALKPVLDNPKATAEQILQAYREGIGDLSHSSMIPTSEFVESFQNLTAKLREAGYDGLTHVGGGRTGNTPHQVLILLDPHDAYSNVGRKGQLTSLNPVGEKPSLSDKANSLADSLESLKSGASGRTTPNAFGVLPYVWDGAINIAQGIIRAGGKAADAIAAAIDHIRQNHKGDFDEDGARAALEDLVKPKLRLAKDAPANQPPEPPEEDWQKLKAQSDAANARAAASQQAIEGARGERGKGDLRRDMDAATPEMQQERRDATAAAQQAREKLLRSPGYIRSRIDEYADAVKRKAAADALGDPAGRTAARQAVEEFHNEFAQMPQGAFADAWKAAQDAGKLPKEQALPVGRSLRDLTTKLENSDIDSPKVPLMQRMAIGRTIANSIEDAKGAYQKAARGVRAAWEALKSGIYDPPENTPFREVMKDWFAADQQTGHETYRWVKAINDKVTNPVRRRAISAWIEANGDEDTLRAQLADLKSVAGGKHVPVWDAALKLTDGEKQIGRDIKADFETKLEDAKNVGMIDKGRENYGVPQLWKTPPKADETSSSKGNAGNFRAKLDPRDPFFSLQREVPSYFDGIMKGGEPKDMDVGKLVGVYNEAFHKNLSSRAAIWGLKDAKSADGTPVVKISGDAHYEVLPTGKKRLLVDATRRPGDAVTKDGRPYRAIDHWALKGWQYKGSDPHGNPVLVKGDFLVHPDHWQFLNNELNGAKWRQAEPGPVGPDGRPTMRRTTLGAVGNAALSTSAFLKNSKMALGMFHLFNVGTHSVWNGVNPVTKGFKIDFNDPKQAEGIRNGLELGFGGNRVSFEEGQTGAHGGLWAHVPGLGAVAGHMTDFIFKDALPKMKMKNYLALNEANTARYGKELTPDQISEISAKQSNDAFGLQNYRLLGSNKVLMDFNRLAALAPDFLGSELKQTANAFTKYGGAQRRAIIVQASAMYAVARVVNAALNNGNSHTEPENAFSVVYKGRSYSIRSVVADMFHMVSDPAGFLAGRLGPLPHTVADMITGRDMRYGTHIDTVARGGISRATEIALRDAASWLAPIGTDGFGPGAAKRGETPIGTLAAAQVGLSSRQYTAQTQMYDAANRFNRSSPDPKAQEYQATRDAEVHQQSVYKGLDNLLQAGKTADAKAEYQNLIQEGHSPASIAARYARSTPFTGNAAREAQFRASLNPGQQQTYQDALTERRQLAAKFAAMPK